MNKGRLIKTVAAVSALVMLTSVTAFAKPGAFEMGNGKIFCFMVYWLVTEYMPAQRRAVRACRPFT